MNNFNDFLGPRSVDVMVRGNDVFAGTRQVIDTGHGKVLSVPIYNNRIGILKRNTVYDTLGRKIGDLDGAFFGTPKMIRW